MGDEMSGAKIVKAAEEAAEVVSGGRPAARIHLNGHAYIPETAVGALLRALQSVQHWAVQRCPCRNEEPDPCPLCGASVANLQACKAVEETFPPRVLTEINAALTAYGAGRRP